MPRFLRSSRPCLRGTGFILLSDLVQRSWSRFIMVPRHNPNSSTTMGSPKSRVQSSSCHPIRCVAIRGASTAGIYLGPSSPPNMPGDSPFLSSLSPVRRSLSQDSKVTETLSQANIFHEIEDTTMAVTFSKKTIPPFKWPFRTG